MQTIASRINDYLEQELAARSDSWPPALFDAVSYALLLGGKRMRPALCLLWNEALGGDEPDALPAAGAVEAIHAFSLVHDDLPAMDDDDLRRGKPTLHVHAGEAMAILAGDALQTLAFSLVGSNHISDAVSRAWSQEISSGTLGMIAGQVHDTLGGHPPEMSDLDRLRLTHQGKTGALITAACRCGAIAAGADPDTLNRATTYGTAVGLIFQATDDLLDVLGDAQTVGKRTGKDADAGKRTYPGLLGIEGTQREVERLLEQAVESSPSVALRELAVWLATRSH